jgi:hypothetical protein
MINTIFDIRQSASVPGSEYELTSPQPVARVRIPRMTSLLDGLQCGACSDAVILRSQLISVAAAWTPTDRQKSEQESRTHVPLKPNYGDTASNKGLPHGNRGSTRLGARRCQENATRFCQTHRGRWSSNRTELTSPAPRAPSFSATTAAEEGPAVVQQR